jgi:hypothetical protein
MNSDATYAARLPLVDRVARWALDLDGDRYGDERERLRQYEAMTAAACLQWIAAPWTAAVVIWWAGRTGAVCLLAILAALLAPMLFAQAYLQRRRVDTLPRQWTRRRAALVVATTLPWGIVVVGASHALGASPSVVRGAAIGAAFGAALGLVGLWRQITRRDRAEAASAGMETD